MQRKRAPGHQFYCPFDAQLRAVLHKCDPGWVPPPPPPPPADIVFESDDFGGPSAVTLQVSQVATLISHAQMQQYRVGYPDASLVAVKDKGSRRFWM